MTDEDREYHRLRGRAHRERNPHTPFYTTSRYLAAKAGVYSDLTMEDALDIYNTPDTCGYCGKERGPDDGPRSFHIDHIIPMIQGGPNSRWNLTKVCASCNTSKGSASLMDFRNRTEAFTDERYDAIVSEMVERSRYSPIYIGELLAQSHEFEVAYQVERIKMLALLDLTHLNTAIYAS